MNWIYSVILLIWQNQREAVVIKRGITAVLGIGVVICLLVVFFYKNGTSTGAKSVTGKELFTDEFVKSVASITFKPFNESGVIAIKDKEKVDEFFEILRNEKYNSIDEYDWIEGLYSFDFVTNDGLENIGINGNIIAFEGGQRRTVSENNLIQGIIRETIVAEEHVGNTDYATAAMQEKKYYPPSDTNGVCYEYFKTEDGRWSVNGRNYNYRLVLDGRPPNAAKDIEYVVLTNNKDITFEEVNWSIISSNSNDDLEPEAVCIVEIR